MSCAAFQARLLQLCPGMAKHRARALSEAVDHRGVKQVDLTWLHRQLEQRFGRARGAPPPSAGGPGAGGAEAAPGAAGGAATGSAWGWAGGPCVERVRRKLASRSGGGGIRGLSRALRAMDTNGDRRLCKDELKRGLEGCGVSLTLKELDDVFTFFDRDRSGAVDFEEFLRGVRGELGLRRLALVEQAFQRLDRTGDGVVTVEDLAGCYDCSWHPEVRSGTKTERQALEEFMAQWEASASKGQGKGDGVVTLQEFIDYYRDVSASVDGDDQFELVIRNAWHLSGGQGQYRASANLHALVTHADGRQSVVEVKDDLGLRRSGGPDPDALRERLRRQGLGGDDVARIDTLGGVQASERNRGRNRGPATGNRNRAAGSGGRGGGGGSNDRGRGGGGGGGGGGEGTRGFIDRPTSAAAAAAAAGRPRQRPTSAAGSVAASIGGPAAGSRTSKKGRAPGGGKSAAVAAAWAGGAPKDRSAAAEQLQAAYRGFRARGRAAGERRKLLACREAAAEEERERARQEMLAGKRLSRPKVRGTYGF